MKLMELLFIPVVACAVLIVSLLIVNFIQWLRRGKQTPLPPVGRHIRLKPPKTRPWIAGRGDRQIRMKKD